MPLPASASAAKISRPAISGIYQRVRLFNLLDEQKEKHIIWITSPPGAGKTTLISSYLAARNCTTLWYQIDEGDTDISTFFYYLGLAGRKISPRKRKQLPLLTPEYKLGFLTFSRNFFRELYDFSGEEFVLVFDNFQDAGEDSELHSVLVTGLEELPMHGRIIVMSRAEVPPKFSRLRANNQIHLLQWEDIRLTEEELKNILILKGRTGLSVEDLHVKIHGWVAGLTLLLEQTHPGANAADKEIQFNPKTLFEYFAGEVLERADADTRNFLVKTSLLPKFSSGMASQLTGISDSSKILNNLLSKNYFTYKHDGHNPVYEYHPLFRDFLLAQAEDLLSNVELTVAKWSAAEILQENGQVAAAVQLLMEVADWEKLAKLIGGCAEVLLKQGRHKTLKDWMGKIPAEFMDNDPWLLYWYGTAIYPFDPDGSLLHLRKSFELFRKSQDSRGTYLAWAAAVEAYRTGSHAEVKQLDYWLAVLDELIEEYPDFPSVDIEARVVKAMHMVTVWRMPGHPRREEWRKRLGSIWPKVTDPALFAEIGAYTAAHDMIVGNNAEAIQVFDTLKRMGPEDKMATVTRLVMYLTDSFINWRIGDAGKSVESAYKGIELAMSTGVHLWDEFIISQGMSGALINGDLATARDLHERLQDSPLGYRSAYYYYVESWYHVLNHDFVAARQSSELALESAIEAGTPFFEALARLALSNALIRTGQINEGKQELNTALNIGQTCRLSSIIFRCLLDLAYWTFREHDRQSGIGFLKEALAIGREKGYVTFAYWLPEMVSEICIRALEENIETDYVRRVISKLDIIPPEPPYLLNNWPWPIRIISLGHCELIRNDKPVEFSRKTQKKPVNLVKALIAFGGQDVPEDKIIEALWPDAEGDAGRKSFNTTLHRVRKLLGDDVIQLQDGRLSLDLKRVWTDVRVFEYKLDKVERVAPEALTEEHGQMIEQALSLYKGHFLADDLDAHWAIPLREKLRNKFLRCLEKFGQMLERKQKFTNAIEWYQRGLEVDMLAEQFYQRLMHCYAQLDRRADAIEAYRQCYRVIVASLGIEPSTATKAIYQSVREAK